MRKLKILTTQRPYCIEIHSGKAREAGATDAEIAHVLAVAAALRHHSTGALVKDQCDDVVRKLRQIARLAKLHHLGPSSSALYEPLADPLGR